jgi:aspartyl-tRNA(Asn)/glutamyl-tRNA(Gln) amidotransferase subunit A
VLLDSTAVLTFTAPFDMSRNPILSQPCGESKAGSPPSLQLVGRNLGEATLLRIGAAYEAATDWHEQRPPLIE